MDSDTEHDLFIGKIYDAMGDYENAKTYLNKVLSETATDPECELANEAKQILSRPVYASDDDGEDEDEDEDEDDDNGDDEDEDEEDEEEEDELNEKNE
ncbi:hypothetical protein GCK32_022333 [Trichostrongylus colubriformis]|uniref:Uncharacterized protein n=1 Tax=Trichostrongylus colubriformis TaxID=6319 RepID=A0AAN8ICX3_TRICO